jgi:hypothetical protein
MALAVGQISETSRPVIEPKISPNRKVKTFERLY